MVAPAMDFGAWMMLSVSFFFFVNRTRSSCSLVSSEWSSVSARVLEGGMVFFECFFQGGFFFFLGGDFLLGLLA